MPSSTLQPTVSFPAVLDSDTIGSTFSSVYVIADDEVGLATAVLASQIAPQTNIITSLTASSVPHQFEVRKRGATVSDSRGSLRFAQICNDSKLIAEGTSPIVVARPITEYGAVAQLLAPHLRHGQTVCLANAPLGAGFQLSHLLKLEGSDARLNIIETSTLFDCAKLEERVILITGLRKNVGFCGRSRNETRRGLSIVNMLSRQTVPCSNTIERGLSDVERILRPVLLLFGIIGAKEGAPVDVSSLLSPSLLSLVAEIESEVRRLSATFKCVVPSFSQSLRDFVMCHEFHEQHRRSGLGPLVMQLGQVLVEKSHCEALSIASAKQLLMRDTLEALTLITDMARLSRTAVPKINSIIELASAVLEIDIWKRRRTVADLGLAGFDLEEIVEHINR